MSVTEQDLNRSETAPALPNGPAAAAILAGGFGTAFFGLMVDLSEWFPPVAKAFTLNKGVGPLSGKTTFGVLGYLVVWFVLAKLWKGKDVDLDKVWAITMVLVALGFIFTFPKWFDLF